MGNARKKTNISLFLLFFFTTLFVLQSPSSPFAEQYFYANVNGSVTDDTVLTDEGYSLTSTASYTDGISYSYGLFWDKNNATVNNDNAISITSDWDENSVPTSDIPGYTSGISAIGGVNNSGDVHITASGKTTVNATGLSASGEINNTGAISVTSHLFPSNVCYCSTLYSSSSAIGINAMDGNLTNIGNITVTATSLPDFDSYSSYHAPFSNATGILASDSNVTNFGNITATAIAGANNYDNSSSRTSTYGIYAYGDNISLTNYGTIKNSSFQAYGIYLQGDNISLTNYGLIKSASSQRYEVGIGISSNAILNNNYTLTLDGTPDMAVHQDESVFGGSLSGAGTNTGASISLVLNATLDLNDATLTVAVDDDISWNTEYAIFAGSGTINGNFSDIRTLNPDISISYDNQGTDDRFDDTLSASYTPKTSPSLEATQANTQTLTIASTLLDQRQLNTFFATNKKPRRRLYASSGMIMNDGVPKHRDKRQFFLSPFYAHGSQSTSHYNSDIVGLIGGYQRFSRRALHGLHFGYSRGNIAFDNVNQTDIDQETLSFGGHALYQKKKLTLRGQLTGYYSWINYNALTGSVLNLTEKANYNAFGVTSKLLIGHPIKNHTHQWLPEVGFHYTWLHQQGFTTNTSGDSLDVSIDAIDEHQISIVANVNWQQRRLLKQGTLIPKLTAGLKHLLTDNVQSISQSVTGSTPVELSCEQDELTFTLAAALQFEHENQSIELAYNGNYSNNSHLSSVWLRIASYF